MMTTDESNDMSGRLNKMWKTYKLGWKWERRMIRQFPAIKISRLLKNGVRGIEPQKPVLSIEVIQDILL